MSLRPPFLADEEIFRVRVVVLLIDVAVPSLDGGEESDSFVFTSESGS
jgi:hypothetical protein